MNQSALLLLLGRRAAAEGPPEPIPGSVDVRAIGSAWGYGDGTGYNTAGGSIFVATTNAKIAWTAHRFALAIPQGATILEARFTPYARNNTNWAPVNDLTLGAEQADDPAIIGAGDYTTRYDDVGTTVVWNPTGGIGTVTSGNPIPGADLAAVIQQIVDRPGWASGQHAQLLTSEPGSNAGSFSWHDHTNATAGLRPRLEVAFEYLP